MSDLFDSSALSTRRVYNVSMHFKRLGGFLLSCVVMANSGDIYCNYFVLLTK